MGLALLKSVPDNGAQPSLAVGKIGILPVAFAHLPAGRMPAGPTAKMAVPRDCELFDSATGLPASADFDTLEACRQDTYPLNFADAFESMVN